MHATIKLWLDDERNPDDPQIQSKFYSEPGMVWVKTEEDAKKILTTGTVKFISFDNDLGLGNGSGTSLANWIEEQTYNGKLNRLNWAIHSMNPVACKAIAWTMKSVDKYWRIIMEIIDHSVVLMQPGEHDENKLVDLIEYAARTCYQSFDKMKVGSGEELIRSCIKNGHESVLEHAVISFHIITSRYNSHELVRHRIASYSQESQRYCAYKQHLKFIKPLWLNEIPIGKWTIIPIVEKSEFTTPLNWITFFKGLLEVEQLYKNLISQGYKPEEAREILPNCTATELAMTANIREWRHILNLRLSPKASKEMQYLMNMILDEFKINFPIFVEDFKL